jgi:hypothetical protein
VSTPGPRDEGRRTEDRGDSAGGAPGTQDGPGADDRHSAEEKRTERQMWWYLAYFLFGIHLVALVMIFAVRHGH